MGAATELAPDLRANCYSGASSPCNSSFSCAKCLACATQSYKHLSKLHGTDCFCSLRLLVVAAALQLHHQGLNERDGQAALCSRGQQEC